MFLYNKIVLLVESLDEGEADYKIAKYIIENTKEVLDSSLRKLASNVYVSPPSIGRFVNRLGISDYKTFKECLELEYHNKKNLVKPFTNEGLQNFLLDNNFFDNEVYTGFLNKIMKAKRIVFLGDLQYWHIFTSFFEYLKEDGKNIVYFDFKTEDKKIEYINELSNEDIAMFVFPKQDIFDVFMLYQKTEFDFITSLERNTCVKYCFSQALSVYPGAVNVIKLPFCTQDGMAQIEMILVVNKLIELYIEQQK